MPQDAWVGFAVFGLSLVMMFIPGMKGDGELLLFLSFGWLMGIFAR